MAQLFGFARLGRDAETRFTPKGDAVANLALAFDYGQKGNDGHRQTQWVDATIWGKRAEALTPHLLKGVGVAVTLDEVHIETFDKRDGGQGFKLVGKVSNLEFAGNSGQQGSSQRPAPAPKPQQRPAGNFADMDDDLPPF